MDRSRLERLIQELLVEMLEDPTRGALMGTPARVAEVLATFAREELEHPADWLATSAWTGQGGMVIIRDMGFVSLCEHHLLPFFGRIHLGYVPRGRMIDSGSCLPVIARVTRRLQLQERLTEQIANVLFEALEPAGLGVAAEGRHMCMMMRGVEKQNSEIQSSTLRGSFLEPGTRREFFSHVGRSARYER